jgi:hypothetical protein
METEALVLRARAELAKLAALYAEDERERRLLEEMARAYEAQVLALEDAIENGLAWREGPRKARQQIPARRPANDNLRAALVRA